MSSEKLAETLRELACGTNRTTTARIRDIFLEIDAAIKAGVRRKVIHEHLVKNGFTGLSFRSFDLALYRIRKERQSANQIPPDWVATHTPQKSPQSGNPLSSLSSKPQQQVFSPIPSTKIEIEP